MEGKYKTTHKKSYKPVDLPTDNDSFIHVDCPSCKSQIESSDINIQDKIAKCSSCNSLFSVEQQIESITSSRKVVMKPVGVERMFFEDELELSIPQPLGVLYAILLSVLPLFMLIGFGLFAKHGYTAAAFSGAFFLFVFTYMLIQAIRTKQNKVYFNVDDEDIRIEWVPKKFNSTKFIPVKQVDQIYTAQTNNGIAVKAVLNTPAGQVHKTLVDGLRSVMIAKYTEQELESHLGIKNKVVYNEIS